MSNSDSSPALIDNAPGHSTGKLPARQLAAGAAGNLIEWFDWYAYAFLSVYFAPLFFPAEAPPLVSLMGTFGILAVGFLARPLASLILGKISDVVGRKFTLLLTVYGMGIGSLMIALAPTYEQVGIVAPAILLLARVIHGVCIGGEYGALSAFAMEIAPQGKRGTVSGILNAVAVSGQIVVVLLVLGAAWLLPQEAMEQYGWRIIFGIAALLSVGGIWIRRGMKETAAAHSSTSNQGIFTAFKKFPRQAIQVVGLTLGFTAMAYVWGSYMPAYAKTYGGLDPKYGMVATLVSLAVALIGAIIAGRISDKFGRRPTMLTAGIILAVSTVPAMSLIGDSVVVLIALQSGAMLTLSLLQASSMAAYSELFPRTVRASGIGFPYSITVALIGGTAPLLGTQFAAWNIGGAFPWYISGLMVVSVFFYATMKETAFKPLPE